MDQIEFSNFRAMQKYLQQMQYLYAQYSHTTQPSVQIVMDGNLPCKSTETRRSKSGGNPGSVYPVTDLVDNSLYYSLIH